MTKTKSSQAERNILIAFLLNLGFSIYEFVGGTMTHSVAIVSDAVHDMGDALSIGISYVLERKSHRQPDPQHTYGYLRYSLMGGLITTAILIFGSAFVIYNAIHRIIEPVEINYDGMIILAIVGVVVNSLAAYFTHKGDSLNQKSVNLHMLEDVLGWVVVLIGAIVMRWTNFGLIDPILSILVALFILKEAISNCREILDVFLEKTPHGISLEKLESSLKKLSNIQDIHHLHVWSMDGYHNYATLHVVCNGNEEKIKHRVREMLAKQNIEHATIELEHDQENCAERYCNAPRPIKQGHHHEHHH